MSCRLLQVSVLPLFKLSTDQPDYYPLMDRLVVANPQADQLVFGLGSEYMELIGSVIQVFIIGFLSRSDGVTGYAGLTKL